MAYDEDLAADIRAVLGEERFTERRMFGGLAFLVGGHMAVAANRSGRLMVRVEPSEGEALLDPPVVAPMVMGGRTMRGWLDVDATGIDDDALSGWVERGVSYARSLPPK